MGYELLIARYLAHYPAPDVVSVKPLLAGMPHKDPQNQQGLEAWEVKSWVTHKSESLWVGPGIFWQALQVILIHTSLRSTAK